MEPDKTKPDKIPCGHCDAGTYAVDPVLNGLTAYGSCQSRSEAIEKAVVHS